MTKYKYLSLLALGTLILLSSCAKKPLTSNLFRQSGGAHIYLPTQKEERSGILAERVDYQTKVDTIKREQPANKPNNADDGLVARDLETLVVTANRPKVKISTIRNGRINLSFLMTLPKAFMNDRYQVVLYPTLINGDKQQAMPPMVLQGSAFRKQQEAEYAKYDTFEKSIIDSTKYDSVYFNNRRHDQFITQLQRSYLNSYQKDYELQMQYDRWKRIMEERQIDHKARVTGAYDARVSESRLRMLMQAYNLDLYGEDSVSIRRKMDSLYTLERREKAIAKRSREIELRDVPSKFRTLYKYNLTIDSLINKSVTEKDSLEVAKHTYKHRAIAHNEAKRKNKDTFRSHMIYLKRVENPHRVDSMQVGKDFVYLYSEDIPVTEDLERKIQLVVDTRVTATDRSTWSQSGRDTLSFIVSGMNDLVDRGQMERLSGAEREEYQQALDRLAVRDYRGALEIFNRYPDYNAAVCLIALGHNPQAEKFLEYLKPANGKVDYLKAIVQTRLGRMDEAEKLLKSAAKKDPQMGFRAEIDPELSTLLQQKPNLLKEIVTIANGEEPLDEF